MITANREDLSNAGHKVDEYIEMVEDEGAELNASKLRSTHKPPLVLPVCVRSRVAPSNNPYLAWI